MRMTESGFADKVMRFILSRDTEELGELTILKIACQLNISQSHLYHIFNVEKKIPPGKFLMMAKMIRAAILLEESKELLPIKVVSKKMGFCSPDYFSRIFKEHFGTTPGKYREYSRQRSIPRGKKPDDLKIAGKKRRREKKT
ncbi:MAG: two-component system, response regulator YesN [Acidobacteriota bacterium]|nr:two-component system, response regulator YesN [Acidobacteriota bacterium]